MSWTSDISGWAADFRPGEEQLARHAARLRGLRGRRVLGAWVVWNLEHDEWFADLPVVLQLEEEQLELCWQKLDDLSLTWGTIDLARPPGPWGDWALEWRPQALPALAGVVGGRVRELAVTRFRLVTHDVDHPHRNRTETWLTAGLWIGTTSAGVLVSNGLDENHVESGRPQRDDETDWSAL